MNKFIFKGYEIELRPKLRSMVIFEKIAKKNMFEMTTLEDVIIYFYSCLLSCSTDHELTFNDFQDELDEHPEYLVQFKDWMSNSDEYKNYFLKMSDAKTPKKVSKSNKK